MLQIKPISVTDASQFMAGTLNRNAEHLYWATRIDKRYLAEVSFSPNEEVYKMNIFKISSDIVPIFSKKISAPRKRPEDAMTYQSRAIEVLNKINSEKR